MDFSRRRLPRRVVVPPAVFDDESFPMEFWTFLQVDGFFAYFLHQQNLLSKVLINNTLYERKEKALLKTTSSSLCTSHQKAAALKMKKVLLLTGENVEMWWCHRREFQRHPFRAFVYVAKARRIFEAR